MGKSVSLSRLPLRGSLFLMVITAATSVAAATPNIAFDASSVVACRDVTPTGFAEEYPGEKLIEAEFTVSARLAKGSLGKVDELYFEIRSPDRRLRVRDYWPTVRYESDIEGTIDVTETSEDAKSAGARLAGSITTPETPVKGIVTPSAELGGSRRDSKSKKYRRKAPNRVVLVSGTTHQGHGLFVKRLPSNQSSIEGSETILCRFIVPDDWQGDWVEIQCLARGERKKAFGKTTGTIGAEKVAVGLFLTGNREAREAAVRLASSQALAEEWRHKMRNRSDLEVAADRLAMSFDSLACNMRLGRCNKHRRNKSRTTPQQSFVADRQSLAELSGQTAGD